MSNSLYFNIEDASQIAIGAFVLAVPVCFSEEAWSIGTTLPTTNLFFIFILSVIFIAFFTYSSVFQGSCKHGISVIIFRVVITYLIAVCVVLLILLALNKFPVFDYPDIAIKRLVVITLPASTGAIIVDSFDKES